MYVRMFLRTCRAMTPFWIHLISSRPPTPANSTRVTRTVSCADPHVLRFLTCTRVCVCTYARMCTTRHSHGVYTVFFEKGKRKYKSERFVTSPGSRRAFIFFTGLGGPWASSAVTEYVVNRNRVFSPKSHALPSDRGLPNVVCELKTITIDGRMLCRMRNLVIKIDMLISNRFIRLCNCFFVLLRFGYSIGFQSFLIRLRTIFIVTETISIYRFLHFFVKTTVFVHC